LPCLRSRRARDRAADAPVAFTAKVQPTDRRLLRLTTRRVGVAPPEGKRGGGRAVMLFPIILWFSANSPSIGAGSQPRTPFAACSRLPTPHFMPQKTVTDRVRTENTWGGAGPASERARGSGPLTDDLVPGKHLDWLGGGPRSMLHDYNL
jgi:hypothetical protein